jgi:hypothetical protein
MFLLVTSQKTHWQMTERARKLNGWGWEDVKGSQDLLSKVEAVLGKQQKMRSFPTLEEIQDSVRPPRFSLDPTMSEFCTADL